MQHFRKSIKDLIKEVAPQYYRINKIPFSLGYQEARVKLVEKEMKRVLKPGGL
jgi:hypothetical protein